ncbi:VOC family protein [Paenibacillus cremeus]|uniref:Glyoxalase n=1 Tax=Paenibacillus cremeus TaxID=2163881 RepID=A0A559KB75_9BACL|nr:VOC family protein [Paenibacillus cremeus]TVY09376.1 glyoxalase [Paenibacillus cremeus]
MTTHGYLGIDHVQLAAPQGCEDEARSFFGGLLGMKELPKPEALQKRGGVWFKCGSHELHIGVQDDYIPAVKAHPAFLVREIEALRGRLLDHGVEIKTDEPLAGMTRFHIQDPFGNRLEFVERH